MSNVRFIGLNIHTEAISAAEPEPDGEVYSFVAFGPRCKTRRATSIVTFITRP